MKTQTQRQKTISRLGFRGQGKEFLSFSLIYELFLRELCIHLSYNRKPEEVMSSPLSAQAQTGMPSNRSFPLASLHPSVDSALEPSPSFEEGSNPAFHGFSTTDLVRSEEQHV